MQSNFEDSIAERMAQKIMDDPIRRQSFAMIAHNKINEKNQN